MDFNFYYDGKKRYKISAKSQDGNGRVGRLVMFKECLKYNIVPFIIDQADHETDEDDHAPGICE